MSPVAVLKEIKPAKFKEKAFVQAFTKEANRSAKDIEKDYKKTTTKWKKKPKWEKLIQVGPDSVEILVGTDNKIYLYVDEGTKSHIILPRKRKVLRWLGKGYGGKGKPKKGDYVFAAHVFHPGFKGYHHSVRIAKIWKRKFKKRMEAAMRRGVKASGHQIK
jgi:hypothetical protein